MELKIGTVIKRLRLEKQLSQAELADKIGVSFQAVSKWETNTTTPDIALLPKIAVFFGVSIDALFSMEHNDYLDSISNMLRDEQTISNEKFVGAERYLKGVLAENKFDNKARILLIELYSHRENSDSLAQGRYAEEGILIEPMSVALNGKLMQIRQKRSEADRLIAFYEPLVSKYPKNYVIIENLIDVYIKNRYFDKAEHLMSISEPRAVFDLYRGDITLMQGDEIGAVQIWSAAAQKHDGDAWTLFLSAERMNKIGEYEKAIALYQRSYEQSIAPKWMDALYSLVFLYEKLGRIADAIATWEFIIENLAKDYEIESGETVNWPRREIARLKSML